MGTLSNAVTLLNDPTFRQWCMAAGAYQARQVILEPPATADHAIRADLASIALANPVLVTDRLVTLIATDPAVAAKGDTTVLVGEALVISKAAEVWTYVARMWFNA